MRIVICGAHQVGKTSLAEKLQTLLPQYLLEAEPYYQLEEQGYQFPEIPTADDFGNQFDYAAAMIARSHNNVIFDRCVIDLLAYLYVMENNRDIQSLYEAAQSVMATIDLIVYVPIEEPDLIPGSLIDLPKLRTRVNDILEDWVEDFGVPVIKVSGSLSSRTDQVLAKIE